MMESKDFKVSSHDVIFSLDIGTKSVVGIVGKKEEDKFVAIDFEIMEYSSRAMYDGQIHDIEKVAKVAKEVKERLEERLDIHLTQVAIAAAGRALKTCRVQMSREVDHTKEIDKSIIQSLEIEGIQKAQEMLEKKLDSKEIKYYCVGHTVIAYYLNDASITSLKGHKGNEIGADILATFLPHVVVDSLYTVMNKIGLEVIHLTLEPIAAIHVAIPPKMRLLNLALVDIGAGTSDIAITKDGTIVSYAMAAVAGDEITETIAKEFLLDFDTAEKLKMELYQGGSHTFEDIVGMSHTMTTEEIIEKVAHVIENITSEIAEKIIEYNGKPPSAVFCIGGGSKIDTLTEHLAGKLGLKKERVVVRGTEIIENIEFKCEKLEGPEFITPIGIGIISISENMDNFIQIKLNGEPVKLFNSKKLSIADALIKVGFDAKKLIARRGTSLTFIVNKQEKIMKGEVGESAKIYLNGKPSSLDARIYNKDEIIIEPAVDGLDRSLRLKELIEDIGYVNLNGLDINLINKVLVNEKQVSMEYKIKDGDCISFDRIDKVYDVLQKFNMNIKEQDVYVNDALVEGEFILKNKDKVVTCDKDEVPHLKNDVYKDKIEVLVNDQIIEIPKKERDIIFVDIFDYFEFDRTRVRGNLVIRLNGTQVKYTDEIKDGDKIEIYWKK